MPFSPNRLRVACNWMSVQSKMHKMSLLKDKISTKFGKTWKPHQWGTFLHSSHSNLTSILSSLWVEILVNCITFCQHARFPQSALEALGGFMMSGCDMSLAQQTSASALCWIFFNSHCFYFWPTWNPTCPEIPGSVRKHIEEYCLN